MDISNRKETLRQLDDFISRSKQDVHNLLNLLEWEEKATLNLKQMPTKQTQEQYHSESLGGKSLHLDFEAISNILNKPIVDEKCKTVSELSKVQSSEDKLLIYEHCIRKTGRLTEPEMSITVQENKGDKKRMTFAEIIAQKRNAKRRTARYRTGSSQSYLMELRNLIELQMTALTQYVETESHNEMFAVRSKEEVPSSSRKSSHYSHHHKDHESDSARKHMKSKKKSHKRHMSRD